jgi:hypothetical protein
LSESEVESLICDKDSVPISILAKLSKDLNHATLSESSPLSTKKGKSKPLPESNVLAVKYVSKDFPGYGIFYGAVSSYEKPFHKVTNCK